MARLEDITVGASIVGVTGSAPVSVVAAKWYGNTVLEITFKDFRGQLANQLLYREDEERVSIIDGNLPWSFDADANVFRLVSESYRINLAHIFDPYLAVHTSAIEPLPHQISAVYKEMLSRLPLRYILADDPGAGKTIMTGLFLKELLVRGDLKRCMIVSPGNLAEQWQEELYNKFNMRFEILNNDRIESAVTGNVFTETNLCIVRLDKLSRNEEVQAKLRITDWDLIVCDEAHKMSATIWGGEVKYTKRFQLGRLLSSITRHFLLLTATPHNGKEEDFQLFMSLIDQDRFEGVARSGNQAVDVSDVMRRLVKEDLLKFDGTPLFPERKAYTVNYDLSPKEAVLYTAVTNYVQDEFNRADQLNNDRKTTVGFALTILQRRLASSPEAIYQSLKRRRERLENRLAEERIGKRADDYAIPNYEDYDDDDMPSSELEDTEERVVDQASAAQTITELEAEISTLKRLERMANDVRQSGEDRKWDELSKLLQDDSNMFGTEGVREKLIIFTEHRDTLRYLTDKIRSLLGNNEAVVTIHGGMLRNERRKVEELFKQDKIVRILIATDAAGEGINLQRAHLMVNYDLPWNPNRLEQRFGRIHRIGQTEVCHLWNLVSRETREGMVFQRLFEKLEQEREALKGKVFDVLGKLTFNNKSLRELLIDAVRYNNQEDVRRRLYEVVDHSLDRETLQRLLDEHALTEDTMDVHRVMEIREDMERMEAHKLQPHFIESFFLEAFKSVGGKIRPREKGRYEITFVPLAVRNRDMQIGFGEPVLSRYERVCFDKAYGSIQPQAALIAPGHPLLEEDSEDLNLDAAQNRETDNNLGRFNRTVDDQIKEAYCWLLVPYIDKNADMKTIVWDTIRISGGNDSIVSKAAKKMIQNEQIVAKWAPALLLMELDNVLWRDADNIPVKKLWEYLCTYCYLPRLAGENVLMDAIQTGLNSSEYFAFASAFDGSRYIDLKSNQYIGIVERSGYLVKVPIAQKQIVEEEAKRQAEAAARAAQSGGGVVISAGAGSEGDTTTYPRPTSETETGVQQAPETSAPEQPKNTHFYMSAELDTTRIGRDVQRLVEEVISHLTAAENAQVEVSLEVNVKSSGGLSQQIVRTVSENCRTLRVRDFGFDE